MPINQPNPERGTGVRRPGTGVRPNPAAGAAPATSAGANRPTGRRLGAPAGARPPLRSVSAAASAGGGSKTNKYLMIGILVALVGMVAYGFLPRKDANGNPKPGLFITLANKYLKGKADAKGEGVDASLPDLDRRYANALACRERAKAYLDDQQKFEDSPDKLTPILCKQVADQLEKYRGEVESGTDDLARVAAAGGKGTSIGAEKAKEEQKKQKEFAMLLGRALVRWRGPKDQIFAKAGAPEFVPNKFNPPAHEERKPEAKRDPRRGETVVAPASPSDIPKPSSVAEPPKPEPKPEHKPEAKPEPKTEPEKPKPADPKSEPEKSKLAEAKPEPEKPKPDGEKPKAEAKAEAKADPKPEAKPEPKPEPEKPKEEAKPERNAAAVVAAAEKLITDGTPMAREIIGASRNLPDDPERLKTLSMKVETAQAFFVKAKEAYVSVKDETPFGVDVATRLAKIEKILSILQNVADGIKSKMK